MTLPELSPIGFGCAPMGGYDYGPAGENELLDAVSAALDVGITLFDTAGVYGFGRAEELLGRALAGRREQVVLATKIGLRWDGGTVTRDSSARTVRQQVDDSLRRLRTDVLDLVQVHWPDPDTPIEETAEALRALQEEGKIRALGCSNFTVAQLEQFAGAAAIEAVQAGYNLLCRDSERELLPWCARHGVRVLAHSTLARGALAAVAPRTFKGSDTRPRSRYFSAAADGVRHEVHAQLMQIAASRGVTPAAVAVRWVIEQPAITSALTGFRSAAQVQEIAAALSIELTADERSRLSRSSGENDLVMSGELGRP